MNPNGEGETGDVSPFNTWRPRAFVPLAEGITAPAAGEDAAYQGRPTPTLATPQPPAAPAAPWDDPFTRSDPFHRLCTELLEPMLQAHRPAQKAALLSAFCRTLPMRRSHAAGLGLPTGTRSQTPVTASSSHFSFFPYLRLLLPHLDLGERPNYQLKESKIAQLYIEVLGIPSHTTAAQQLLKWRDPRVTHSGTTVEVVAEEEAALPSKGNSFSDVLYYVLRDRGVAPTSSTSVSSCGSSMSTPIRMLWEDGGAFSIAEVHVLLDQLAACGDQSVQQRYQYRPSDVYPPPPATAATSSSTSSAEPALLPPALQYGTAQERRRFLFQICTRRMSPVEHRWLLRILLKDLKLGWNHLSIFKALHPAAWAVYSRTSRLRSVCEECLDAPRSAARDGLPAPEERHTSASGEKGGFLDGSISTGDGARHDVAVFQPCKPMLAAPLHVRQLRQIFEKEGKAFVEPKYDGERLLLHARCRAADDATAGFDFRYFTRNGKDFTTVYAPTYNPVMMAHLTSSSGKAKEKVKSFITDGEMMIYDANTQDFVPFGLTRTFSTSAEAAALAQSLLLRPNHAPPPPDPTASAAAAATPAIAPSASVLRVIEQKSQRWFCYIVFDLIALNDRSLLHLPLTQRRAYLQQELGLQSYFASHPAPQRGEGEEGPDPLEWRSLDVGSGPSPPSSALSPAEISFRHHLELVPSATITSMAAVLQSLHDALLVEKREGVVIKAPGCRYLPGERRPWAWMKLKHDHVAKLADTVDLLVVGAYFGTKFGKRQLTHFLLGAWKEGQTREEADVSAQGLVHTVCKVGNGYNETELKSILETLGPHWENPYASHHHHHQQPQQQHGETRKVEEASERQSYRTDRSSLLPPLGYSTWGPTPPARPPASSGAAAAPSSAACHHAPPWLDGWVPANKDLLPDLYIHPRHSVVFEVMAYAFVEESKNYRVGFTLRFPRLLRVRWDKSPADAATVSDVVAIRRASEQNLRERLAGCIASPDALETVLGAKRRERSAKQQQRRSRGFLRSAGAVVIDGGGIGDGYHSGGSDEQEEDGGGDGSIALKGQRPGGRGAREVSKRPRLPSPSTFASVFERAAAYNRQQRLEQGLPLEEDKNLQGYPTAGTQSAYPSGTHIPSQSTLFHGYEFCVLSFRPLPKPRSGGKTTTTTTTTSTSTSMAHVFSLGLLHQAFGSQLPATKPQLEALLQRHGARVVANPLSRTTSLLLGDDSNDLRVVNWIHYAHTSAAGHAPSRKRATKAAGSGGKAFAATDVVRWPYALECLARQQLLPLAPRHMLYTSPALQAKFSLLFDPFEDPYYDPCESLEELRYVLGKARAAVDDTQRQKLESTTEVHKREEKARDSPSFHPISVAAWLALWRRVRQKRRRLVQRHRKAVTGHTRTSSPPQEGLAPPSSPPPPPPLPATRAIGSTPAVPIPPSLPRGRCYAPVSWDAFQSAVTPLATAAAGLSRLPSFAAGAVPQQQQQQQPEACVVACGAAGCRVWRSAWAQREFLRRVSGAVRDWKAEQQTTKAAEEVGEGGGGEEAVSGERTPAVPPPLAEEQTGPDEAPTLDLLGLPAVQLPGDRQLGMVAPVPPDLFALHSSERDAERNDLLLGASQPPTQDDLNRPMRSGEEEEESNSMPGHHESDAVYIPVVKPSIIASLSSVAVTYDDGGRGERPPASAGGASLLLDTVRDSSTWSVAQFRRLFTASVQEPNSTCLPARHAREDGEGGGQGTGGGSSRYGEESSTSSEEEEGEEAPTHLVDPLERERPILVV
eukprot:gene12767-8706_t